MPVSPGTEAPFRFAVSATFTSEPLEPVLRFWARRLATDFDIHFAPYNQVEQTLLDPRGAFAATHHGLNVILLRFDDLGAGFEANARQLVDRIRAVSPDLTAPLLVIACPPFAPEIQSAAPRASKSMAAALDEVPSVHFVSWEQIAAQYPVAWPHDAEGERLGRIPYTETFFAALGTSIVRHAQCLSMRPYKVIVLDCDYTLWRGVCGEDGPSGVVLDPPRRALQEFMAAQRDAGMLLAMASKNNEADVLETFAAHPEMPLQLRHFAGWRINWDSKAENLASLSSELDLGLDSFVFVDDNPKECAEVSERVPEVLALALPEKISDAPGFLNHVWAFDHTAITEEDRNRGAYYQQAREFGREARAAHNLEEFLRSLHLEVTVSSPAAEQLGRVAQLTQRTNQFNTTTIRRNDVEIGALLREPGVELYAVHVRDRFGDYGLTGVLISRPRGDAWAVDSFLLSCRVLGRGVEHRVLEKVAGVARERGFEIVEVPLVPSARNAPARQFLESIGSQYRQQTESGLLFRFPVPVLLGLAERAAVSASAVPASPPAKPKTPRPVAAARRFVEYAAIARELGTPEAVVTAMRRESLAAHQPEEALTHVELELSRIWSQLLERRSVGRDDNFFDLGGHSLLAVLLLLRVRETFGVELSIDDVYSGAMTLAGLAARIEAEQLSRLHPEQYAAILAEVEALTDEEVRACLAREEGGSH